MSTKTKFTKLWVLLGKISAGIITLGTLYQIGMTIFSKEIAIEAKVQINTFRMPPQVGEYSREFVKYRNYKSIERFDNIEKFLESYKPSNWHILELEIKNTGEKSIKNLNIELKENGYFQLEGQETKETAFEKIIRIEEIRPSVTIKLFIWVEFFNEYKDDAIKITHENGFTIPEKGRTVYGIIGILSALPPALINIFLILMAFLIYQLILKIKAQFPNS